MSPDEESVNFLGMTIEVPHLPVTIVVPNSKIKKILGWLIFDTVLGHKLRSEFIKIDIMVKEDKDIVKREKIIDVIFFGPGLFGLGFSSEYRKKLLKEMKDTFAVGLLDILKVDYRLKEYDVRIILGEDKIKYSNPKERPVADVIKRKNEEKVESVKPLGFLAPKPHLPVTIVAPNSKIKKILDWEIFTAGWYNKLHDEFVKLDIVVSEDKDIVEREKIIDAIFSDSGSFGLDFSRELREKSLETMQDIFAIYLLGLLKSDSRLREYDVRTILGEDKIKYSISKEKSGTDDMKSKREEYEDKLKISQNTYFRKTYKIGFPIEYTKCILYFTYLDFEVPDDEIKKILELFLRWLWHPARYHEKATVRVNENASKRIIKICTTVVLSNLSISNSDKYKIEKKYLKEQKFFWNEIRNITGLGERLDKRLTECDFVMEVRFRLPTEEEKGTYDFRMQNLVKAIHRITG